MVDVGLAAAVVALVVAVAVPVVRSKYETTRRAAGLPSMHSSVEAELAAFASAAPGVVPNVDPRSVGTSDVGEPLQQVRSAQFDGGLGLRGYSIAVFVPGTQRYTIGGSARVEPLAVPQWRPDGAKVPSGTTTHQLVLRASPSGKGVVAGSGNYAFGTVVPIVASPFPGRTFLQWSGTAMVANRTAASTTVTIDEDRTLTAVFAP